MPICGGRRALQFCRRAGDFNRIGAKSCTIFGLRCAASGLGIWYAVTITTLIVGNYADFRVAQRAVRPPSRGDTQRSQDPRSRVTSWPRSKVTATRTKSLNSARLRASFAGPRVAPGESGDCAEEGRRSERAADRFGCAQRGHRPVRGRRSPKRKLHRLRSGATVASPSLRAAMCARTLDQRQSQARAASRARTGFSAT